MSPLEAYEQKAKEFKITKEKQVHPRQKQAFIEAQTQEQKMIINRLLFDCALASIHLAEAKDDLTRAAHSKKLASFEDDLRQLTKTLDFYLEAEKELGEKLPAEDEE